MQKYRQKRMTGLHKKQKYLADIKGICIHTVGKIMTLNLKYFILSIVKS
jgi:hypothetical protein